MVGPSVEEKKKQLWIQNNLKINRASNSGGAPLEALVAERLSSFEVDSATEVQVLDEVVCISHHVNTLRNGRNPIIPLSLAMGNVMNEGL